MKNKLLAGVPLLLFFLLLTYLAWTHSVKSHYPAIIAPGVTGTGGAPQVAEGFQTPSLKAHPPIVPCPGMIGTGG